MSKYAGTETEENLKKAFAGESQARNKYTYFASAARKTDLYKLQIFLKRLLIRRKSMQKCGLKNCLE